MHLLGVLGGLLLIALILVDAFETIIQPRRVTRRVRLTRREGPRRRCRLSSPERLTGLPATVRSRRPTPP